MLSGTFEQWVPLVMEGLRDDRAVQLLVDVTSPKAATSTAVNTNGLLFQFESTDVKRSGTLGHRLRGVLTSGARQAPAEFMLEVAPAHTPFAVLSFSLPPDWEGLWDAFSANANARQDETEVRARGWLRTPALAAA